MSRRRHRSSLRDANEAAIVAALIAAGASVSYIDGEDGEPDLLVGFGGATELMEVKRLRGGGRTTTGGASRPVNGGDGVFTKAQIDWREAWRGKPAHAISTVDEALAAIGATAGGPPPPPAPAPRRLVPRRSSRMVTSDEADAIRTAPDPAKLCASLQHPRVVGGTSCACGARAC